MPYMYCTSSQTVKSVYVFYISSPSYTILKNVNICSYNEKWERIIHYSERSTKHTRNLSKILVFFLPNPILVNEIFNCQKTSHVSTPTGRGPKLSVTNTTGHVLRRCRHFLSRFSHQFTRVFSQADTVSSVHPY